MIYGIIKKNKNKNKNIQDILVVRYKYTLGCAILFGQ